MKKYTIGDEIKVKKSEVDSYASQFDDIMRLRNEAHLILQDCQANGKKLWDDIHEIHPEIKKHRNTSFNKIKKCFVINSLETK